MTWTNEKIHRHYDVNNIRCDEIIFNSTHSVQKTTSYAENYIISAPLRCFLTIIKLQILWAVKSIPSHFIGKALFIQTKK